MDKVIFNAQIRDQKLHIIHRSKLDQFVRECGWSQVQVTLSKKKKSRSLGQNAYLFGVCYPMIAEGIKEAWGISLSKDEVHSFCKIKFCKKEIVDPNTGEVTTIPGHTSELSTTQFADYIADIQKFAQEYLNTYVPDPGKQIEMFEQ